MHSRTDLDLLLTFPGFRQLMESRKLFSAFIVVVVGGLAMSLAYFFCYCCRKRRKQHGADEESLQGILADGNSSTKDLSSVKSHNGVLNNFKIPLFKTKSLGYVLHLIACMPTDLISVVGSIHAVAFSQGSASW